MSRERQIAVGILALMALFGAMSWPIGLRLLAHDPRTLRGTWLIVALAAELASVLSLAVIAGVGGYWLSRLEYEPVE